MKNTNTGLLGRLIQWPMLLVVLSLIFIRSAAAEDAQQIHNPSDSQRSFSSIWRHSSPGTGYALSRLGSSQAWSAGRNTSSQWLEIPVQPHQRVVGVTTQGRHQIDQWVESYRLQARVLGGGLVDIQRGKVFSANTDSGTKVSQPVTVPIGTTAIRIIPRSWHRHVSLRAALQVRAEPAAGEELLKNGSFEQHGVLDQEHWGYFDSIVGWHPALGQIEVQTDAVGGIAAAAGTRKLELDARRNSTIYQDVATEAGHHYTVGLSYSPRMQWWGTSTNGAEVWWGDERIATLRGHRRAWQHLRFEVTAKSSTTRLTLKATGRSDGYGALIDAVSVRPWANLQSNGSFENHGRLNRYRTGVFSAIPAWRASSGLLELHAYYSGGITAATGSAKLELDAYGNSVVQTSVPTQQGLHYKIQFAYSPRISWWQSDTNDVEVWWGSQKLDTLSGDRRGWQYQQYTVTATQSSSELIFKAVGRSDGLGGFIDDVSVFPVPDLISNGSFETHPPIAADQSIEFQSILGWRVQGGTALLHDGLSGAGPAADGRSKVQLPQGDNAFVFRQLALEPGQRYRLELSHKATGTGAGGAASVWLDDTELLRMDAANGEWSDHAVEFTAIQSLSLFSLRSLSASGQQSALIDRIRLYCLGCLQVPQDRDGDGVVDADDAFPDDPYETTDTDSDGIGDNADSDDDNDGLPDVIELLLGLNPLATDSDGDGISDGQEDSDGDGINNLNEVAFGLNPADPGDANTDLDGDGLETLLEVLNGLNPLDSADALQDKDGDGLSNYRELKTTHTHVNLSDSDGDGWGDQLETAFGSDANQADSDALKAPPIPHENLHNPRDDSRKFSSIWSNNPAGVAHGRSQLESPQAWSAARNQAQEWIEIPLGIEQRAVGIVTQGRANHEQWVSEYTLQARMPSGELIDLNGGLPFQGNQDRRSKVQHRLDVPLGATAVRLMPTQWHKHISLRVALLTERDLSVGANVLVNGSFENHAALNHTSWGTFAEIPGWRATAGLIEIQRGNVSGLWPVDGDKKLELDSTQNSVISQTVQTTPDQDYWLSFAYSPRLNNPGTLSNDAEIWWGEQKVLTLRGDRRGWRYHRIKVTAQSDAVDLILKATGASDSYGALIDKISLRPVLNLVENGSFELHSALSNGSWGTFDAIPGWVATQGQIELQSGGVAGIQAIDGNNKLEIDAHSNSHVVSSIATFPGQQYQLQFAYSPRVQSDGTDSNDVEVWWGDSKASTLSGDKRGWTYYSFLLTAEQDSTELQFRGAGSSDGTGGLLDDVRVFPVVQQIENGFFEQHGALSTDTWGLFDQIPGWRASAAQLKISRDSVLGIDALDGDVKLVLDIGSGSRALAEVNTVAGQYYLLSFNYSPAALLASGSRNDVELWWNGERIAILAGDYPAWRRFSVELQATSYQSTVEFRIADGAENSAFIDLVQLHCLACTEIFSDRDGDGVADAEDAFPNDATEWSDNDGDGTGDNADLDDDNDGLSDLIETALSLNPLLTDTDGDGVADGDEDSDSDGIANLLEIQLGLDPTSRLDLSTDSDGDGLFNVAEVLLHGTHPLNPDTDGDGLPDGHELDIGLSPTNEDTDENGVADGDEDQDSDGLSNGRELSLGTSAINADSDGDGLQDGLEIALSLNPLKQDTDDNGTVDGDEDSDGDGLTNALELAHGLNPADATDAAQDSDGDGLSNKSELLNHHTDPRDADSDNDGLPDGIEVSLALNPNAGDSDGDGTADADEDSDGDGLSNGDEIDAGTALGNADSDADGLSDGLELALGLNPLDPDTDGNGTADGDEDSDADGLSNALELAHNFDPANPADAEEDADNDGLSNRDELLQHNSDPNNADSDGDQLPDGLEVGLGLDPSETDSDSDGVGDADEDFDADGLSNIAEVRGGTDPAKADSDGDGLDDGLELQLGLNPLNTDSDGNGTADGAEDSDADGLTNALEVAHGLDPADPADAEQDADSDGLSNKAELLIHNSDPNNPDSDDDQLPDGLEVALGLSPTDKDSDHNGTEDGDEDSDGDGLSNSAELAGGTSPGQADTDGDGLDDGLELTLGLNPLLTDSDADGTADGDEDFDADGLSNALEIAHGLNPADAADAAADADGDGLSNSDELLQHHTDPNNNDSDGDTLPDGVEVALALNPLATDTDGDGTADGDEDFDADGIANTQELALGTDPANADSDGDGLSDGLELSLGLSPLATDTDGNGTADGDEDHDGDGLSNSLEIANGLAPDNAADADEDADNDGLSNRDELLTHHTDIHDKDSDGDGLNDGAEVQLGIDPNNGDSDGDGVGDSTDTYPGNAQQSKLAAVTGLSAATEVPALALSWSALSDQQLLAAYRLERRIGTADEASTLLEGSAKDRLQYIDDDVENGQGYQYRITAIDTRGNLGEPSAWLAVHLLYNQQAVSDITAQRDASAVSLVWPDANADGYRIYRQTGDGGFEQLADAASNSFSDGNAAPYLAYGYKVASLLRFENPFDGQTATAVGPLSDAIQVAAFVVYNIELDINGASEVADDVYQLRIDGDASLAVAGVYRDALGAVRITAVQGDKTHSASSDNGQFTLRFGADDLGSWRITAQDQHPSQLANNTSVQLILATDQQPPLLAVQAGMATSTAADSFILRAVASDDESGIADVYASSDRFAGTPFQGQIGEGGSVSISVPLLHGPNVFSLIAIDGAGNQSTVSHTVERAVSLVPVLNLSQPQDGSTTTDSRIGVAGQVYSNQPLNDLRILVGDHLLQASGAGGDAGYSFQFDNYPLELGANSISVRIESPGGEAQQTLIVQRIDADLPPAELEALAINVLRPLAGTVSSSSNINIAASVSGGSGALNFTVGGQGVPLSQLTDTAFSASTVVSLASCDGSVQAVDLVLSDQAGQSLHKSLELRCDNTAPVISLLQPAALQADTDNPVAENPLPLLGEVVDNNLAGLSVNGQSLVLAPTGAANTYRFEAQLQLLDGSNQLEIQAWDKANNSSSLGYNLLADLGLELTVLSPVDGSEFAYSDQATQLDVVAQAVGLAADDTVSLQLNGGDSQAMALDGETARRSMAAQLLEGDNRLIVQVRDAGGQLRARKTINFRALSTVAEALALESSSPAAGAQATAPNEPLILYFNQALPLDEITLDVSQSVHGPGYDLSNQRGVGFTELPEPELVQINIDRVPVLGSRAPFNNRQVLGFYPREPLHYGATVYVEVSHQGSSLGRFSYQVQDLPTIVSGAVTDIFNQPIASVLVSLPQLGLSSRTDAFGNYNFGGGEDLATPIPAGRYKLLINPGQDDPAWGSVDQWLSVQRSRAIRTVPHKLPVIASTEPFVTLRGGDQFSLHRGAISLDLGDAELRFARARSQGNVQVQMLLAEDLPHRSSPAAVPIFAWHLQAGADGLPGIGVEGSVGLRLQIPSYLGGYDHVPFDETRVLMLGLDERSGQLVPVGVGKVEGRSIVNTTDLHFDRLDYIAYAFVTNEGYPHLLAYERGEYRSLGQLRAKLEELRSQ